MTTASLIQSRIDKGNAIAARQAGVPYQQYRPTGPASPISAPYLVGTIAALFSQDPAFTRLPRTKSDEYIGYFDGSQTQAGDYLTNGTRTFFVSSQQPMLPYLCVNCERVITLSRPNTGATAGLNGYSGTTTADLAAYLTSWPASCSAGTKGERSDLNLPDDVRTPWWVFRLPSLTGVLIKTNDVITDDLGRTHTVSSAELTEFGWRLTARQDVS